MHDNIQNANTHDDNGSSTTNNITCEYQKIDDGWIILALCFYFRSLPFDLDKKKSFVCDVHIINRRRHKPYPSRNNTFVTLRFLCMSIFLRCGVLCTRVFFLPHSSLFLLLPRIVLKFI